jgi:plastocyanin
LRRKPDFGRRVAIGASLAACAAVLAVSPDALAADRPHAREVVIRGLQNVPETVTVKRGDVVLWINKDPFPHTVTAAGAFDSGPIAAGKSWRFTARRAGTYPYGCTLHSNMKGTLRVE